jgi:hypothetical protein
MLEKSKAGETRLAAMFTDRVATSTVTSAYSRPRTLSVFAASWTGSQIVCPYTACEPEVTSTDSSANSVMVVGRPRACPQVCAFCDLPYRVKSGMFSDSVDQKPIMPIRDGQNSFQKLPPQPSLDGWSSSGPNPPALLLIQISITSAPTITNGAAQFSKRRIVSMPR